MSVSTQGGGCACAPARPVTSSRGAQPGAQCLLQKALTSSPARPQAQSSFPPTSCLGPAPRRHLCAGGHSLTRTCGTAPVASLFFMPPAGAPWDRHWYPAQMRLGSWGAGCCQSACVNQVTQGVETVPQAPAASRSWRGGSWGRGPWLYPCCLRPRGVRPRPVQERAWEPFATCRCWRRRGSGGHRGTV